MLHPRVSKSGSFRKNTKSILCKIKNKTFIDRALRKNLVSFHRRKIFFSNVCDVGKITDTVTGIAIIINENSYIYKKIDAIYPEIKDAIYIRQGNFLFKT